MPTGGQLWVEIRPDGVQLPTSGLSDMWKVTSALWTCGVSSLQWVSFLPHSPTGMWDHALPPINPCANMWGCFCSTPLIREGLNQDASPGFLRPERRTSEAFCSPTPNWAASAQETNSVSVVSVQSFTLPRAPFLSRRTQLARSAAAAPTGLLPVTISAAGVASRRPSVCVSSPFPMACPLPDPHRQLSQHRSCCFGRHKDDQSFQSLVSLAKIFQRVRTEPN